MKKLSFDSTPTLKGIVFQFLVALDRCFEMQAGESVFIETFGDVSVLGGDNPTQIESKCYKTDLTDLDENVWNTIHNWMRDDFPIEKFSSLFLLTTQKAGKKSEWGGWNKKGLEDKLKTLNRIKEHFDKKKRKSEKLTSMMDAIFDASKSKRLAEIAKKLFIDCLDTNDEQFYKSLLNRDKSISNIQKEKYINSLLGWIIRPQKKWTISNEDFEKEAQEIAEKLRKNTVVFPDKLQLTDIKNEEYEENSFVRKIKDIEYDEVIPEAVDDYVHTVLLIEQELRESLAIRTQFEEYEKSKNRITYIHLRDFDNKTNKYAHLGEGDIGIEKFMEIIKRDNFDGVISIETHLPMNESGETKQELFLKSINLFYSILEKLKIKI